MRHDADAFSLVLGLAFLAFGLVGLVGAPHDVIRSLRWLWPIALVAAGFGLLATSRRRT